MQMPYVGSVIGSEALVEKGDLLLAGLALRVARDVTHGPGPEERNESDEVLELGRFHLAQRLTHAGRLELEDTRRVTATEHRVRLVVVEREVRDVDIADQGDRLVDDIEVAQPEEVHLEQAERLDVLHRELGHDLLVGPFLLERHVLDERPVADDDTRGVDRVLSDEPFEGLREIDDLARDLVLVVGLTELLRQVSCSRRGRPAAPPESPWRSCPRRRTESRVPARRRAQRHGRPSSRR